MLDIGWSELLVIGVVALIVVGPKDLPIMFRRLGEFTGKARGMAREFSRAMDKAADEAGVKDIKSDLNKIANPKQFGLDEISKATQDLQNWDADDDDTERGPNTATLSKERAEAAKKVHAATARMAEQRLAREAAEKTAKEAAERHAAAAPDAAIAEASQPAETPQPTKMPEATKMTDEKPA